MSVLRDLLLVALDPGTGRVRLPSMNAGAMLGGAALLELVSDGRVDLEGRGRKARTVVLDPSPVDDAALEQAFGSIRHRGREAPKTSVRRLGRTLAPVVLDAMVREGSIRDRGERRLGVGLRRFDVVDVAARDALLTRLREVLLADLPADARTGPLVGLLHAGNLLRLVVQRPDVRRARERAADVAEGDWASDGVRRAVRDVQAALASTAAVGALLGGS